MVWRLVTPSFEANLRVKLKFRLIQVSLGRGMKCRLTKKKNKKSKFDHWSFTAKGDAVAKSQEQSLHLKELQTKY